MPPFKLYDQRSTPQGTRMPTLRPTDIGGAEVSRALMGLSDSLQRAQQERDRWDEEDGRIHAAGAIAQYRARANAARRDALEQAPDGFRELTNSTRARLTELRQEFSDAAGAVSPIAKRFVEQSIDAYDPLFLDETAEHESAGRSRWQSDTASSAIDAAGSVIAADPTQYEPLRAQQLEALSGIVDADLRRDLTSRLEENLAVSAISGLVERDPRGALRLLRDPEAGGPVSRLSGPQRNAMENRAQAEINRREAEARARQSQYLASLRDTVAAQRDNARRGVMPSNPLPVDQLARALGPDVAQAYAYDIQSAMVQQGLVATPSAQVAQAGVTAPGADASDFERGLATVTRDAAASVLTQRANDPGGYGVRNNLFRHPTLMQDMQQARQPSDLAWEATRQALRDRGADAVEAFRQGVLPRIAPFSNEEARSLSAFLEAQDAPGRAALFSQLRAGMSTEAYLGAMRQIAPSNRVAAHAGAIAAQPRGIGLSTPTAISERALRGQALLAPPHRQGEAAPRPFQIPSDDGYSGLRAEWRKMVGDAYRGTDQEGAAYDTYRALYAHYANMGGISPDSVNKDISERAMQEATGGVQMFNGRRTLTPYGWRGDNVEQVMRRNWQTFQRQNPGALDGLNVDDVDVLVVGNGQYKLMYGGTDRPIENPQTRRPVIVRLRP